jgi:alpha-beta hydrolase superfamily lysophospholipase
VLFFHGNGENISTHFANVYWLPEQGYDVYLFDYRGYGNSTGVAQLDAVVADFDSIVERVLRDIPADEKLVIMGHSFGASLSIYGVAHSRYRARFHSLISVSAFADYQQITQEVLSRSWLTWWLQWPVAKTINNDYRALSAIPLITPLPLLIMHGEQDEIVAVHHALDLFAAARQPRQLVQVQSDHNYIFNHAQNRELVLTFLATAQPALAAP